MAFLDGKSQWFPVARGRSTLVALVKRLNDPVYRHRALQFIADAVIAALAFFLAFQLRFLDVAGGIPTATGPSCGGRSDSSRWVR